MHLPPSHVSAKDAKAEEADRREAERIAQLVRPYHERLETLRRAANRAHRPLKTAWQENYKLSSERGLLAPTVFSDESSPPRSPDRVPHPSTLAETARLDREISAIEADIASLTALWQPQATLLAACEHWFAQNSEKIRGGHSAHKPLPVPTGDSVAALRDKIGALAVEQDRLERAFPAASDAVRSLTSKLEFEAHRAVESIGGLALLRHGKLGEAMHYRTGQDAIGLMAALIGPQKMAENLIGQALVAHPDTGISEEQRRARLVEIDRERRAAERLEEALIRASEDSGQPILRRPDANPFVVMTPDDCPTVALTSDDYPEEPEEHTDD